VNSLARYSGYVYTIVRIVFGLMFACHGLDHVFGTFGGKPGSDSFIVIGGWIELITGFLVALGLSTRPAAFLASGTMAVAYFKMHFSAQMPLPIINHGDSAVLYCFSFLYVFFHGPGMLAIDNLISRTSAGTTAVDGSTRRPL